MQALGQVALGTQFEFDAAAVVDLVKQKGVGLPRKAADDLAHSTGPEKGGQAGVVVDHSALASALLDQAADEPVGDAWSTKATDQDRWLHRPWLAGPKPPIH